MAALCLYWASTLLFMVYMQRAATSRAEASLDADAWNADLTEGEVQKHCEEAVQSSRSAKETIQALQSCINELEKYSSQSRAAHAKVKQSSQSYASDVNVLDSFLQSLKTKLDNLHQKHEKQYNTLLQDQRQDFSGFLEKLGTMHQALNVAKPRSPEHAASRRNMNSQQQRRAIASSLRQAKQSSSLKSKKLQEALRKVAQRKQRRINRLPRGQDVPSLLQLSAQDGEGSAASNEGGWSQMQDSRDLQPGQPTSLVQLAATATADAAKAEAPPHAPASLLEQEVSKFATLFWKPWKPVSGNQPALQNIVGIGFTRDDAEARTAVNTDDQKPE